MKQHSSQWKSPRLKKSMASLIKCEDNVDLLFYLNRIVHREFSPPRQMVNHNFYLDVLSRSCETVRQKHLVTRESGVWFLRHNNTPTHTAYHVQHFYQKNRWPLSITLPTHPILLCATFSCSCIWKKDARKCFSTMEKNKEKNCCRHGQPVSYTHLDVYKRQVEIYGSNNNNI